MLICFTYFTQLFLLWEKLYTNHAGNAFIYTVRFSGAMMGQERGWAPLKAGFNPPVASATDCAKAVIPSFP